MANKISNYSLFNRLLYICAGLFFIGVSLELNELFVYTLSFAYVVIGIMKISRKRYFSGIANSIIGIMLFVFSFIDLDYILYTLCFVMIINPILKLIRKYIFKDTTAYIKIGIGIFSILAGVLVLFSLFENFISILFDESLTIYSIIGVYLILTAVVFSIKITVNNWKWRKYLSLLTLIDMLI